MALRKETFVSSQFTILCRKAEGNLRGLSLCHEYYANTLSIQKLLLFLVDFFHNLWCHQTDNQTYMPRHIPLVLSVYGGGH